MSEGLDKLYSGDFNTMNVQIMPDGSRKITLSKDGEAKIYRFHVVDLYGPDEQVLSDEVVDVATPDHIKKRVNAAISQKHSGQK